MHFLCLHGLGTNSQVFEVQTAGLRYELGDQHTFEFVEGTIPWPMAPGISSLFDTDGSYYSYFDPNSPKSALDALHQLDEYVMAEGPFDGVLAFSQGACLAAMHLIRKRQQDSRGGQAQPPFNCAIFLSSIPAYDAVAFENRGEVRLLEPATDGQPIQIPTVHIWGQQEDSKKDSELLKELCNAQLATIFVHGGGHEVPGLGAKGDVTGAVKAIRRAILKAQK
ncbi:Uncharacterized protein BP5553_09429 [Venustampulla echinocandica]|uniref:Serine hydrolase domain-containing protein n=1 Tax=Venustampulla echinocandica TaxID=2656787 RepID=A0A370TCP5_9HELO|nr:Uncharacterized protein BP5553_09429 [Venustampulla echinocandica]RDL32027.1 Uncharacterized protein BP5553_09429 [Venustampulla echinocandica]